MTAFYVSASGKDNWAGTLAKPWRTIAKANAASLAAGDSVLLRRGDVWHEMLRPASGVTYGAYGEGDNPLLTADGARRACVLMLSVHDVVIDRIDCDGPTSSSLGYDRHAPIYTDEHSSNITVKNLRVTKGGFGVQDGALDALDLDYAVGATNLVYDNIEATDCLSTGIYHRGTGAILNCKSHDNGLGDTGVGDRGGIGVQGGPLLIQGNEIWNIGEPDNSVDFAISLWRPQGVITISRNYIHDITCGCVQFYQGSDGHVVANNIFEDYGTSTAGDIDGKHSGVLIRYTNGVQVLHNVFSHGGTSAHAICHCICAHGDASDTRILNNICYECENPFVFILPNAITDRFVCDHNMFYKSDGNYSDGWRWKSYHAIDSLSAWCSATGQAAEEERIIVESSKF